MKKEAEVPYGEYPVYLYRGMMLMFYSTDTQPIVHAEYDTDIIRVSFTIKEGEITRITYKPEIGDFSPEKLTDLKRFLKTFKYRLVNAWSDFYVLNITPRCMNISIKV